MGATVALRSNFAQLLAPGLFEVIFEEFNRYPDEYTKILQVKNSKRQYEEGQTIAGVPITPVKLENEDLTFNAPINGFNTRVTHTSFAGGIQISREMMDDDLYGTMEGMSKKLSIAMKQQIETTAANLLNNAFSSGTTYGDGIELCATNHTLRGGGTEQNELTTAADLSQTSLQQATIDLASTTDDMGIREKHTPKLLIVPINLMHTAPVILNSQYRTNSANNDINPMANMDISYTVNHYLTSTVAWFLQADQHKCYFFWRVKPKPEADDDFRNKNILLSLYSRFSTTAFDWRGIFGSPGTGN